MNRLWAIPISVAVCMFLSTTATLADCKGEPQPLQNPSQNYVINLLMKSAGSGETEEDLSIVVAQNRFDVTLDVPLLRFSGKLKVKGGDTPVLQLIYNIDLQRLVDKKQYRTTGYNSSVCLEQGKPVTIVETSKLLFTVKVTELLQDKE